MVITEPNIKVDAEAAALPCSIAILKIAYAGKHLQPDP